MLSIVASSESIKYALNCLDSSVGTNKTAMTSGNAIDCLCMSIDVGSGILTLNTTDANDFSCVQVVTMVTADPAVPGLPLIPFTRLKTIIMTYPDGINLEFRYDNSVFYVLKSGSKKSIKINPAAQYNQLISYPLPPSAPVTPIEIIIEKDRLREAIQGAGIVIEEQSSSPLYSMISIMTSGSDVEFFSICHSGSKSYYQKFSSTNSNPVVDLIINVRKLKMAMDMFAGYDDIKFMVDGLNSPTICVMGVNPNAQLNIPSNGGGSVINPVYYQRLISFSGNSFSHLKTMFAMKPLMADEAIIAKQQLIDTLTRMNALYDSQNTAKSGVKVKIIDDVASFDFRSLYGRIDEDVFLSNHLQPRTVISGTINQTDFISILRIIRDENVVISYNPSMPGRAFFLRGEKDVYNTYCVLSMSASNTKIVSAPQAPAPIDTADELPLPEPMSTTPTTEQPVLSEDFVSVNIENFNISEAEYDEMMANIPQESSPF